MPQTSAGQWGCFTFRIGARKTEIPVSTNTMMPVTLCSLEWRERQDEATLGIPTAASGSPTPRKSAAKPSSPHTQELGLLPWGTGLCLHLQAVDVGDGDDGSCHVPGQPHEGAHSHEDANPEQVEVVARCFLQCSAQKGQEGRWGGDKELPLFTTEPSKAEISLYSTLQPPMLSLKSPESPLCITHCSPHYTYPQHPTLPQHSLHHLETTYIPAVSPTSPWYTQHCCRTPHIAIAHPASLSCTLHHPDALCITLKQPVFLQSRMQMHPIPP